MNCSLPSCSVYGILQARILEWVVMLSSRGSSQPRDWTQVFLIAHRLFNNLCNQESPRILECIAYPFSRGSSWPRNWTRVSCTADRFFTSWATRETPWFLRGEDICGKWTEPNLLLSGEPWEGTRTDIWGDNEWRSFCGNVTGCWIDFKTQLNPHFTPPFWVSFGQLGLKMTWMTQALKSLWKQETGLPTLWQSLFSSKC